MISEGLGEQILSFTVDIVLTVIWICAAIVVISITVRIAIGILADVYKEVKKLNKHLDRSD